MTKDQFFALKRGDVVIEKRSGTPRKVLAVHLYTNGAGLRYGSISLRQLRASWRHPCQITTLNVQDCVDRLSVTGRRMRVTRRDLDCGVRGHIREFHNRAHR